MSTVEELRAAIAAGRSALREAIAAAAERWEEPVLEPDPRAATSSSSVVGPWTPRHAATHVIWVEGYYAGLLSEALGGERTEPQPLTLTSPAEAARALDERGRDHDAVLARVRDADLGKPAALGDGQIGFLAEHGITARRDVEGLLRLLAAHLEDHAQQIRSAF
jgi:predicted component of type VI protein secretion system